MPLGPQFQNTFYEGAGGKPVHYTDPMSDPHAKAAIEGGVNPGDHKEFNRPYVDENPAKGVAYQGMLFSPEHFTGLKTDPTISEEERRSTIEKSLHLGKDEYAWNIRGQYPSRNVEKVEQSRKAITDAAHETAIPTHMFKQDIDVKAIASNKLGSTTGGDFNRSENKIRTRVREDRVPVGEETVMHQPRQYSGKNLVNPNWEKDTASISHRIDVAGLFKFGYGNSYEAQHIFAGKGESTEEYAARNMKIHTGYGPSGRRTFKMFHVREEKAPVGEPKQITRNIYENRMVSSKDTIAHEIGHSLDRTLVKNGSGLRYYGGADSVHEAIADGVSDRFVRHGHDYERTLSPSPERAMEIKKEGYGFSNRDVAGTDTKKALYAAVRTHVAMGDKNYLDIENRRDLYNKAPLGKQTNYYGNNTVTSPAPYDQQLHHANQLLLGHLYSTHQHVRDMLGHLGLGHVGEAAAQHYRTNITDAGHGQQTLPGFDEYGK